MSCTKPNFYEILNVSPNATAEELKTKYKQMILQCHPDKLQQQQQKLENTLKNLEIKDDPNSLEFVALTEAWNCLKDPIKRKQYDAQLLLNKFHTHNNIYAHITLKEMKKVTNTKDYYFQDDDDDEELNIKESKEENKKTETLKYLYTYDCRCGGQYIVDESAEQYCRSGNNHHYDDNTDTKLKNSSDKDSNGVGDDDDADPNTQNNKTSPNIKKYQNNGGSGDGGNDGGSSEGVVFIQDNDEAPTPEAAAVEAEDDDDGELIVECSECSLVIILNG